MPDQWLANHRETELFSGPDVAAGSIVRLPQFSVVQQLSPQQGLRIKVHYFGSSISDEADGWVTALDMGPIGQPQQIPPTEPEWMNTPTGSARWLANHRETSLFDGEDGAANAVADLPQFSILAQLARQRGPRIPVYYYGNSRLIPRLAWVTALDVGPIGQPQTVPPAEPESPDDMPRIIEAPSPNHAGKRFQTVGCVIHSTRGNASSLHNEFVGTLNHFMNPASEVSAHIVIAADGTIAKVVDPDLVAFHAGEHNHTHLGIELVQPRLGDEITDAQYRSCAIWLKEMTEKFGFALDRGNLPEHRETSQGAGVGKSDVGLPYSFARLKTFLDRL